MASLKSEDQSVGQIPVSVSPKDKFEEYLRTKGMRFTQERSIILEEVFASHEHFDADQLTERLAKRKDQKRVSRATVYRALCCLEDAGLLRKVARNNDREIYEHDYGYSQHDHLICKECGEMIEFENQQIRELIEKIAETQGFLLENHRLEAFGLCQQCSGPKERPKKLNLL